MRTSPAERNRDAPFGGGLLPRRSQSQVLLGGGPSAVGGCFHRPRLARPRGRAFQARCLPAAAPLRGLPASAEVAPGRASPARTMVRHGRDHEGCGAALGPRSIRAGRSTTDTSGHPKPQVGPAALVARSPKARLQRRGHPRAAASPAGACQRGKWPSSTGDESPLHASSCRRRQVRTTLVLAGRATSVPFTTVTTGPERTTTDNAKAASNCAVPFPRR